MHKLDEVIKTGNSSLQIPSTGLLALDNLDYSIIVMFNFDENHTNDEAYSHKLDDKTDSLILNVQENSMATEGQNLNIFNIYIGFVLTLPLKAQ